MKQILILTLLAISILNCKAQIRPMEENFRDDIPNGSYYKDVNNILNTFEGTWLYTNGTSSIKIKLTKVYMYHSVAGSRDYYEDLIIGGYQYIENGVEKINSLTDADYITMPYDNTSIWGSSIHDNCKFMPVDDCVEGEKRLILSIMDPITEEHFGDLVLHKRTINGQEALKATLSIGYAKSVFHEDDPITYPPPTIPNRIDNMILIRQ